MSLPYPVTLPGRATGDEILACADALRAARPGAEPVAFWDFDGTLFEGDCSEGFMSGDRVYIPGLVAQAVAAGWSRAYPADGGFARCWQDYQALMERSGAAAAYPWLVRVFAGAPESALRKLAAHEFNGRLRPWFFAEALDLWRKLEDGGVRGIVISASADFFVKGAAEVLEVPPDRLHGLRLGTGPDGLLTDQTMEPVTVGEGKADLLRQLLAERGAVPAGGCFPAAAIGNDFFTDGPMLEAVARAILPGGTPVVALVNSPPPPSHADCLTEISFARRRLS